MANFLKHFAYYQQYLQRGPIDLQFPPYETDPDNRLKVYSGEVFCRVAGCERGRATPAGRLSQPEKGSVMAWYKGLFDDLGRSDEEEEPEEEEEEVDEASEGSEEDETEEERDSAPGICLMI
ncbi:hypothetical protein N7486_006720 [Penicillium sp. IBT 16267x]|nr:hypothetical protein N7486_006720 [Penicillium sp. IBT 16267x]